MAYSLFRNCSNKLSAKRYVCRDLSRKRAAVVLVVAYGLFDCTLTVGGRYNTRRIIAVMDRHKLSSCKKERTGKNLRARQTKPSAIQGSCWLTPRKLSDKTTPLISQRSLARIPFKDYFFHALFSQLLKLRT